MVVAGGVRSSRRGRTGRCAVRATTDPTFDHTGSAGAADALPLLACGPRAQAPTSASTATRCPTPTVSAAGGTDHALGSRPATPPVSAAFPDRRHRAPTAARTGRQRRAGPRARSATRATTPRSGGEERAPSAARNGDWCPHLVRPPPDAVTAPGSPRCTSAVDAAARTSSMSGAAAIAAPSPGEPPTP